jgi:signal transduction histidine kinase
VHDVKGHGLGLNYVAGVVRLHQGQIEVNSQVGVGTEFTVRFPSTPE